MNLNAEINPERNYYIHTVADKLFVARTTVYRWIKGGLLKAEKHATNVTVIKGSELLKFINNMKKHRFYYENKSFTNSSAN